MRVAHLATEAGRSRLVERMRAGSPLRPRLLHLAAGLSIACGVIHLAVASGHFDHSWIYGGMLVLAGAGQLTLGAALLARPSQQLMVAGIAMTAAIVSGYVVTRTWGVPFGEVINVTPSESITLTGDPEPVGPLDIETTVAELVLVVALVSQLRGAWRRWTLNLLVAAGLALWVLRLTGVLEPPSV